MEHQQRCWFYSFTRCKQRKWANPHIYCIFVCNVVMCTYNRNGELCCFSISVQAVQDYRCVWWGNASNVCATLVRAFFVSFCVYFMYVCIRPTDNSSIFGRTGFRAAALSMDSSSWALVYTSKHYDCWCWICWENSLWTQSLSAMSALWVCT